MKILFKEHISKRNLPVNFKKEDTLLFEHEFEKKIANTHIIQLKRAFIIREIIIGFSLNLRKYLSYSLVHPDISIVTILKKNTIVQERVSKI
jgi:hypothetical protein